MPEMPVEAVVAECCEVPVHDTRRVPPGVSPTDNEAGWKMAFEKLARLLEPVG